MLVVWYRNAIDIGSREASSRLAHLLFETGDIVVEDLEQVAHLLEHYFEEDCDSGQITFCKKFLYGSEVDWKQ